MVKKKRELLAKLLETAKKKEQRHAEQMAEMQTENEKTKALEAGLKVVEPGKDAEMFEDMDEETRRLMYEEEKAAMIAREKTARKKAAFEADLEE